MTVPDPPAALARINAHALAIGSELHRLHDGAHAGSSFNPCGGRPTRFAPIFDMAGHCVPSMYAAESLECAAFETIFHDVPAHGMVRFVIIETRAHTRLRVKRELALAKLFQPELKLLGLERRKLIDTAPRFYRRSAAWAKAIHDQYPAIDGLVWTSRQCDPLKAYLFFGDRVVPADFEELETRHVAHDAGLLAELRSFGQRAGISIVIA